MQPPMQQQQPGSTGQIPMMNNNYAVGGQSTFNQSPLEWQQQQQIQQQQFTSQGGEVPPPSDQSQTTEGGESPPPPADVSAEVAPNTGDVTADQVPLVDASAESATKTADFPLDELNNMKDTWDPYESTDIPMFWQ